MSKKNSKKIAKRIFFVFALLLLFFSIALIVGIHYKYPSALANADKIILKWVELVSFIALVFSSWVIATYLYLFILNKLFKQGSKLTKEEKKQEKELIAKKKLEEKEEKKNKKNEVLENNAESPKEEKTISKKEAKKQAKIDAKNAKKAEKANKKNKESKVEESENSNKAPEIPVVQNSATPTA